MFSSFLNVPSGSELVLVTATESEDLLINVSVIPSEGETVTYGTASLLNQSKKIDLAAGTSYGVRTTVNFGSDGASLALEARIITPEGTVFGKPHRVNLKGNQRTYTLVIAISVGSA